MVHKNVRIWSEQKAQPLHVITGKAAPPRSAGSGWVICSNTRGQITRAAAGGFRVQQSDDVVTARQKHKTNRPPVLPDFQGQEC